VPVLTDGEATIRDSQAILVYLAKKYGSPQWLPEEPGALAEVMAWLSTAANEVSLGPNRLRLHHKFRRAINLEESTKTTESLLQLLEARLENHKYLTAGHATIADITVYPYIALSPEGSIDFDLYPAVTAWLRRIQALPGYVHMPGMWQST
jgi:glutathione S-transferase